MNKAPAFQFYAQDFLTGTMYLTNEEIGIYIKMIAKQWTDGKIPKKRLGFLTGLEWDKFSDELKSKFIDDGEFLINSRLEQERDKKQAFIKKQSENGKKGGRPPKQTKNNKPKINPSKSQKKPLEDEYEEEEEIEVLEKEVEVEKKQIPKEKEFIVYALQKKPLVSVEALKLKRQSWIENGWKTGGERSSNIKNWKTTLLNTLPYLPDGKNEIARSNDVKKKVAKYD